MGKYSCCLCKKELGLLSGKSVLKDGAICVKCLRKGGISSFPTSRQFTIDKVHRIIDSREQAVKDYRATKHFGRIEIDANTCSFKIDGIFYLFDDLIGFSYHEDPNNLQSQNQNNKSNGAAIGGMIGGLRGGLLGGAVGAAVGGAVGGAVSSLFSATCDSMYISIAFRNAPVSDLYLHFITEKTKTSSSEYASAAKEARACLNALQIIKDQNEYIRQSHPDTVRVHTQRSEVSKNVFIQDKHFTAKQIADELEIYKTLLYNGDITQEEYDQKKKQLLSLR